jgi:carbon monoxide dehydrogenase subunit G
MQIKNRFDVPLAPAAAWSLLMNVPVTVTCFPGAELVETVDADHYKGRVTVKLGPMTMVFSGNLTVEDRDDARHSATVRANWTETRGRGNAVTLTRFELHELAGGTVVGVDTDVQLAGQVAQYGRGAGMIAGVSEQLISRFAENLRAQISSSATTPAEAAAPSAAPQRNEISVLALLWRTLVRRLKRFLA